MRCCAPPPRPGRHRQPLGGEGGRKVGEEGGVGRGGVRARMLPPRPPRGPPSWPTSRVRQGRGRATNRRPPGCQRIDRQPSGWGSRQGEGAGGMGAGSTTDVVRAQKGDARRWGGGVDGEPPSFEASQKIKWTADGAAFGSGWRCSARQGQAASLVQVVMNAGTASTWAGGVGTEDGRRWRSARVCRAHGRVVAGSDVLGGQQTTRQEW